MPLPVLLDIFQTSLILRLLLLLLLCFFVMPPVLYVQLSVQSAWCICMSWKRLAAGLCACACFESKACAASMTSVVIVVMMRAELKLVVESALRLLLRPAVVSWLD